LKINIFYSWQSDLPNNTNRGLIQTCIEKATQNLSSEYEFEIEFNLDRDTKGESGTPSIVDTIFNKINKSYIFIADITLINFENTKRKTPNPNVLLELGFASKAIGWNKIICLYNLQYGQIEELPFDLKFRRPLSYLIDIQNKANGKKLLIKSIEEGIKGILKSNPPQKRINDELKVEVDTEILSTLNHLFKILFNTSEKQFSFSIVSEILEYTSEKLNVLLEGKKILGFKIYKNWSETENKINILLDKPLAKYALDTEILNSIVSIIWKIKDLEHTLNSYSLFKEINEESKNHKITNGTEMNPENAKLPNRWILLRHLNEDKFLVEDHGDFTPSLDKKLLLKYFVIEKGAIPFLSKAILNLFEEIKKWLDLSDNEFIVDEKMFRPQKISK
jgi:hypothetical protein